MKKYIEIYNYYKDLITAKQLKSGDKMPSVRKATDIFNASKTTIQNAYFALQADGYIIAVPKSGYYISDFNAESRIEHKIQNNKRVIKYDLKSGDADKDSFDINLWQRYIKNALRQQDRLLSYSEVQGERDLREALSDYIREKRNVTASPDRIVVGAGVQCLLNILCSLIKERKTVSFPDSSFYQGMSLFKDYGFEVHTRDKDAKIIYVSPSHMTSYGDVMPIKRRVELVRYSQQNNSLVIEDDYDNDFLYQTKPTPSLYALSGCGNVIYMGSFSNVLIPGIRISFMVLTKDLAEEFERNKEKYAQTASKTEQIALCQYIRDGHIKSQTRKVRRLYTTKTKVFYETIKNNIPNAKCEIGENGLQIKLSISFDKDISVFEKNSLSVHIKKYENNTIQLILSPSALNSDDIYDAVNALKSALL
ncbi:MAG: PLP-dependent aminotransferase family protein [Eubacterium sp.]